MAIVLALQTGWIENGPELRFVVLGDFKSLRQGIEDETIDAFLWEIITTKVHFH